MKKIIPIIIISIILLICFIYLIYPKTINKKEEPIPEYFTITYTYGGGFGTQSTILNKEIIIKSNGEITIQLENNNSINSLKYNGDKEEIIFLYK